MHIEHSYCLAMLHGFEIRIKYKTGSYKLENDIKITTQVFL